MIGGPRPANLGRVDPETFIFIALQAAAVLGIVAVVVTMYYLGSHGPELDR